MLPPRTTALILILDLYLIEMLFDLERKWPKRIELGASKTHQPFPRPVGTTYAGFQPTVFLPNFVDPTTVVICNYYV